MKGPSKAGDGARRKPVLIEGIGDGSAGGGAVMAGQRWQGVVFFRPWKLVPEGPPSKELLRVLLPERSTSGAAARESRKVKTGVVYRFNASFRPRRKNQLASAELCGRLVRVGGSGALAEADAEVSATVRVKDPTLGALVRRPRSLEHEGRLKLSGRTVPLYVVGPVERASALFARVEPRLTAVPPFVARTMLRLANEVWLDEPISENELRRRLKLTEAWIDARGLHLSFSCGDTFGDHGLAATVGPRGAIKEVRLQ